MILYGLVSRGRNVLAEYTFTTGNFPTITRVLLGKITDKDQKMSYVYDQYVFHYVVENHITYLCMCDDVNKRRVPFTFLDEVKAKFQGMYGDKAQTAIAYAMNNEFGAILKTIMERFNGAEGDTFSAIHSKIDDVKNVMVQNIDNIMERGEKLELLVDKTDKLQQSAFKFERSSKQLKNAMLWRRVKLYLLIAVVVALALWLITSLICGFDYSSC